MIDVLPNGAVFAIRHGSTLVNQVLPGPAEDGLFRLFARELQADGPRPLRLTGAGVPWTTDGRSATWHTDQRQGTEAAGDALLFTATLQLHPCVSAWRWHVRIRNRSANPRIVDVLLGQDLGLSDEAAVRNNEAYTSQYVDFQPFLDEQLGWTLLARQNQRTSTGHPWLALAVVPGAAAFCTDGLQFFGADHRLTGEPEALRRARLPSLRLQGEIAFGGLQTAPVTVPPHDSAEVVFYALFRAHHPDASAPPDLAAIRAVIADSAWPAPPEVAATPHEFRGESSLFVDAPWCHGEAPDDALLAAWFRGPHRAIERDAGQNRAFFRDEATHVVTRAKEAHALRPHGHVLRSGDATQIDPAHFGLTVYAAGLFAAQSYLGNPSLNRLLSVARNSLGVIRASGQRVFVHDGIRWRQLGIPSAFALTPGDARWIYQLGAERIEVRVWCSTALPAGYLELRVSGRPRRFLVTHQLALGANEFDRGGFVSVLPESGWVACAPAIEHEPGAALPEVTFALAAAETGSAEIGGDAPLRGVGNRGAGPYVTFEFPATLHAGVIQLGASGGSAALAPLVSAARQEFASSSPAASPPPPGIRFSGGADPGVAHIQEILPWFNHNAGIHFSAPHGLEQYAGGAWGVRDVCQGSLEWLLAIDRAEVARRMLAAVFAQQYLDRGDAHATGTWPQWFMLPPDQRIQQAPSHGDVCLWPVKALADYLEATADFDFARLCVDYTDPTKLQPAGREESLWCHCDRVVEHVASRFLPGTALVDYGEGDWDDTLQPADPALGKRMTSAWTVALAFHAFGKLAAAARHAGETERAARLEALRDRMRADFEGRLIVDDVVAGFVIEERDGTLRPLLHPSDTLTGIRYRLLPMTRAILAELFTPEQAQRHLGIIAEQLWYPDGVRLMSKPAAYRGGLATIFRRAELAANVGREIGLQYVHAHLRYAEALAKVGDADGLWRALRIVNPVGLQEILPNAAPRQSNVYFSSSDADFPDRYAAAAQWPELRSGSIPVRGGWRLYSSGPGLFLHQVVSGLLGVRREFDAVVFDPVLPRTLDGLTATVPLLGRAWEVAYRVRHRTHGPESVAVNGTPVTGTRAPNPYRRGGLAVPVRELTALVRTAQNHLEINL